MKTVAYSTYPVNHNDSLLLLLSLHARKSMVTATQENLSSNPKCYLSALCLHTGYFISLTSVFFIYKVVRIDDGNHLVKSTRTVYFLSVSSYTYSVL